MKIELQKRVDHKNELSYWIFVNGSAQIPIYRDEGEARHAYHLIVKFHENPPAPVVLESVTI